jgi:hypothetical protein
MSALASAVLYLLALDGVASAMLAWGQPTPLGLAGWAVALGVAQGFGERLGLEFASIEEKRRDKVAVFLGTIHLSVLVLALVLAAGSPTPKLLGFLTNVLSGYALLVLLLVRLTPHPRAVVGHSLALIALACLKGGPLAAWASSSALALTGLFVGLDHHLQLLGAHRVDDGPHAWRAFGRAALLVLPVALVVGVAVHRIAPEAVPEAAVVEEEEGYVPLDESEKHELDMRALRALVLTGVFGAVAVYVVGRWIVRSKRGEKKIIETPEPLRGAVERIRPEARSSRSLPEYRGSRGRVVRAYLNLLRGAERAGFPRRPSETPDEFAAALAEPREPLESTTEAFLRARYGGAEVSAEDVTRAESGADAVLGHLSRQPRRRRVVRDADETRPDES